jgi:hypothetical protein
MKKIEVPDGLYADFINVLFAADRHVKRTDKNERVMMFIKEVIGNAFHSGEVLVVNGTIIDKKNFNK